MAQVLVMVRGLSGKSVFECERIFEVGALRTGGGEGRLRGEFGGDLPVRRAAVEDAVAAAKDEAVFLRRPEGKAEARREVIRVGIDQARRISAGEGSGEAGRDERNLGHRRVDIEIRQVPVLFREGREVFVADAQVQREAGHDAEIVLRVDVGGPTTEIVVRVADAERA